MLDRFNLTTVWLDYARSMVKYPGGRADVMARAVLWGLPVAAAGAVVVAQYRIANPVALTPVAGLMAGIFFASVGQLISIRARIADSVQLSQSKRLKAHMRESVSGMLLAAVGSMILSLLLGVLSLVPVGVSGPKAPKLPEHWQWSAVALSATAAAVATYVVLLFISSARRVYASYLEAFEGGIPLARGPHARSKKPSQDSRSAAPESPGATRDPAHDR
jgi:hypothetical protein